MPRVTRFIGQPLARIGYVRRAIEERADLSAFRERPSVRLVVGVTLITLSSFLGWPAVVVAGCLALEQRDAWIFLVGGPSAYAVSWLIWGLGLLIATRDALRYANLFTRWLARRGVELLLGGHGAARAYVASLAADASSHELEPDAGAGGRDDEHEDGHEPKGTP